ncbi:MAG: PRTRC system ParB family protein [Pseudomonas sp.]|nr:PRTRC system ParB family protein [Pseudomonas sp.]
MNKQVAQVLPLNRIRRNPLIDPRKGRKKSAYDQLVRSIGEKGIIQPILVRPVSDDPNYDHEVVAGNSRWTAAHDVGLSEVPALIRSMSDQEARLMAALENQVRSDLTPIEEALHAVVLLGDMANDHQAVMKALDWSRTKLDSRLLLAHACDEVAEALLEEHIKIGHAELLCRLPPADQAGILAKIMEKNYSVEQTRARLLELTRDVSTARFDTAECRSCIHNSGANADLFEVSLGESRCQNPVCWNTKTDQLISVRLIEAQDEHAIVHSELNLAKDSYVKLAARGDDGVGEQQAAACATCGSFGAVVMASRGREGDIVGGMCFNRPCQRKKNAAYKTALDSVTTSPPASGKTGKGAAAPARRNAGEAKPAQVKKSLRREAFDLYARMSKQIVLDDRCLTLAVAIVSMYFEMRNDLKSELRAQMEKAMGLTGMLMTTARAEVEIRLAQLGEEKLLTFMGSMAAASLFRTDSSDQFDWSVSGAQALKFMEYANADPATAFVMNESYLKAQVKAGIIEDCKRSGFADAYNSAKGEKAFDGLVAGKSSDLIEAILGFKEFSWLGYLPTALELSAQGGKNPAPQQPVTGTA